MVTVCTKFAPCSAFFWRVAVQVERIMPWRIGGVPRRSSTVASSAIRIRCVANRRAVGDVAAHGAGVAGSA